MSEQLDMALNETAAPPVSRQRCASCAVTYMAPHESQTVDHYYFCPACVERYTVEVTGGRCYRPNTCVSLDGGTREWIGYAREHWFYVAHDDSPSGDWYEREENVPPPPPMFHHSEDVLEHCKGPHSLPSKELLLGVELEMESIDEDEEGQQRIARLLGGPAARWHIVKGDGSLNYGCELVTVPLTLEEHRKDFGWSDILRPVRRLARSGQGTKSCGMHVHLNRGALSALTIGKMGVFLNSDHTDSLIRAIAQRSSNGYCDKKDDARLTDAKRRHESRYERLNLQNSGTVEMRIFKGNLRTERIMKNLEFAHATAMFCKSASINDIERPAAFHAFLKANRGIYPNLIRFLQEHGHRSYLNLFKPHGITKECRAPALCEE